MNKRIEVGCLVMIIHAEEITSVIGKVGTVVSMEKGEFISRLGEKTDGTGWWDVDVHGYDFLICRPASSLLRIDDYTEETETQEEEMVV